MFDYSINGASVIRQYHNKYSNNRDFVGRIEIEDEPNGGVP